MPRKSFRPGVIIAKRREADVQLGQGKKVGEVVKALGVSEVSSGTSCSTRGLPLVAGGCAVSTSTCRSLATISSAVWRFLAVLASSSWREAIPQGGPLLGGADQ